MKRKYVKLNPKSIYEIKGTNRISIGSKAARFINECAHPDSTIIEYKLVKVEEYKREDLIIDPIINSTINGVQIQITKTMCLIYDNDNTICIKTKDWEEIKEKLLNLGYISEKEALRYERKFFEKL